MAHANIFQKVNKEEARQPVKSPELKNLEALKTMGEELISLREIIEEQHNVIGELAETISVLKQEQKETQQNFNLTFIDQKDLAKQIRVLRSNLEANQYVQSRQEMNPVYANSVEEAVVPNPVQSNDVQREVSMDSEIEELFFKNAQSSPVIKNSLASNALQTALEEIKKLEKPKRKFLAKKSVEEKQSQNQNPAMSRDEELARKIIFGKTPRFINPAL